MNYLIDNFSSTDINSYKIDNVIDNNDNMFLVKLSNSNKTKWVKDNNIINKDLIRNFQNKQIIESHNKNIDDKNNYYSNNNYLNNNSCKNTTMSTNFYKNTITNINSTITNINSTMMNKNVYIYTRVSTKKSTGVSLEVQLNTIINFCKQNNCQIIDIKTDDGISAKNMNNLKELNKLIDNLNKIQDDTEKYIFIYDISRFSRNLLQALTLLNNFLKKKIYVHFCLENITYDDNYNNKYMVRSGLNQAQFLSESISEKVKNSIKFKKNNNKHIGGIPFGYTRKNGLLILNTDEVNVIKSVNKMFLDELNLERKMKNCNVDKPKSIYKRIFNKLPKKFNIRGNPLTINTVKLCIKRFNEIKNKKY